MISFLPMCPRTEVTESEARKKSGTTPQFCSRKNPADPLWGGTVICTLVPVGVVFTTVVHCAVGCKMSVLNRTFKAVPGEVATSKLSAPPLQIGLLINGAEVPVPRVLI